MAASKGSAAEPRNIPDGPVAIPWGNVLNPKYDWDKVRRRVSVRGASGARAHGVRLQKEVLEVIYWLRQAVALLCGLLWGLLGVTGFIGNVSFILICLLVAWVYYAKIICACSPRACARDAALTWRFCGRAPNAQRSTKTRWASGIWPARASWRATASSWCVGSACTASR